MFFTMWCYIQCQYSIPAFSALVARVDNTTARLTAIHFSGHGCMYDLTNERSLDSQGMLFIDVLGLLLTCYPWVFVEADVGRHLVDWCRN